MVDLGRPGRTLASRGLTLVVAAALAGCAVVPGSRLDESQRLVKSLRTENARLKDQVLGLEVQNRDYADRALDDLRRLTARDQAIERLARSVQGYQDDRDHLAAAYRRLAVGLGRPTGEEPAGWTVEPDRAESPGRRPVASAEGRDRGGSEHLSGPDDEDPDAARDPAPPSRSGP